MEFIEWSDRYSVGVREIDDQHRMLFSLVNNFHQAIQNCDPLDGLRELLHGLVKYVREHFAVEEKYFDRFGYIDSVKHKKEHAFLAMKVGGMKTRFDGDRDMDINAVAVFLKQWIENHIDASDKLYRDCFHENGLR